MSIIRRIILRIRRRVPRYKAWEEMPTGWLLYFLVSTAIPVGLGAALLVSIVPELYQTSQAYGIGLLGALIGGYLGVIAGGLWFGRNLMKRCGELIYERCFR